MTIGANLNGGSLTIGANNATVNIPSGNINAKYFTLRQTTYGNATNTFLIDTTQKTTFTTQMGIADTNAEEVYIGNGAQLKKIVIANIATTVASEIKIGNSNSTTTISGAVYIANIDTITPSAGINIYTGSTSNIVMGNTRTSITYIKGKEVGLGDDGGTIAIGSTSPLSGTTSILNIRTPLTVGYAPSAITSISHIGGTIDSVFNFGTGNTTTVFTAYPCINNVPQGIYIIQAILYFYAVSPPKNIFTCLCRSSSPISSFQTSNFTVIGDSKLESFSQKPNTSYPYSISLVTTYRVSNPDNNIAFGVLTSVPSADTIYSKMTIMRIA